ncbi:hypothetical protein TTHERM_000222209 (macronuclear) [Tetrahymena thermophila SB210]|uniref:Transmembrane protein n=1 Tax=Tetrahymena thermophila (strain SB210) TaxID=312017 RepID=W7XK84_TETTS|nr:hypothetical protein TTHERM_000222209 [Tetrahymena thermophila SB210]EWS74704.1 hypothetical protein TTHERM_000222209 [Tetrahymena thermophila SB210]|eukprot:XP_012652705.1 hypothetical protein TTHERM_000222209 [Tetrahymena thermophila SB210]
MQKNFKLIQLIFKLALSIQLISKAHSYRQITLILLLQETQLLSRLQFNSQMKQQMLIILIRFQLINLQSMLVFHLTHKIFIIKSLQE